mmetsp:Transcript_50069/g.74754  ORF Transcript_50069/g.74754 Transcript_50069/m.74754 type:complete len:212 (-) Transcript_50069:172-807(-)
MTHHVKHWNHEFVPTSCLMENGSFPLYHIVAAPFAKLLPFHFQKVYWIDGWKVKPFVLLVLTKELEKELLAFIRPTSWNLIKRLCIEILNICRVVGFASQLHFFRQGSDRVAPKWHRRIAGLQTTASRTSSSSFCRQHSFSRNDNKFFVFNKVLLCKYAVASRAGPRGNLTDLYLMAKRTISLFQPCNQGFDVVFFIVTYDFDLSCTSPFT